MAVKIVSGGQTGVDRAALDFAIDHGIAHGGWCPRGRLAEDGIIDARYQLEEADSAEPAVRTEKNVVDSDGTLVVVRNGMRVGGTALTCRLAETHGRPVLVIDECEDVTVAVAKLADFIAAHGIVVLNVAGPRESQSPRLAPFVRTVLARALPGRDAGGQGLT